MKRKIQNRHDKIVKETFSKPEIAKEYFRQFLPSALKNVIDVDSIVSINGTYITEELREYFTDLLFQFKIKNGKNRMVISLLFEHKANPDKHTLIQVGNYIFTQWIKEIKSKQKIVPIIPLIYYQGKKEWQIPTIRDLFSEYPEAIQQYLPSFDFVFFALNTLTNDQLNEVTDAMLLIALTGHNPNVDFRDFAERLKSILTLKRFDDADRNLMTLIFVYKITNSEIEKEEILSIIESLPNPINKEFMSTYDAIKIEGKIEEKIETILSFYEDKLPIAQMAKYVRLPEEDVKKILKEKGKI